MSGHDAMRLIADAALPPSSEPILDVTASFDELYDDHVDFVWRSIRRLGVSEGAVDDVVQQVFLVVHRRLHEYQARASIKSWLFAILLNAVREHRRSVRRKDPHLASGPIDPDTLVDPNVASNPERALEREEASRVIDRLLETLEMEKRLVFVMAELEQMTPAEIAEATGLSAKTIYTRVRAARVDFERAAATYRRKVRER